MPTFRTRKAAAENVKHQLTHNVLDRSDVPRQLWIIKNYRPGKRPTWTVTGVTPGYGDRFHGPITGRNVEAITERFGVVWPMSAPWFGPVIDDHPRSSY